MPSSQNEVINNEDDDLYSDDFAIDEDPHDVNYSPDILECSHKSSETWSEQSSQLNDVRI